MSVGKVGDGEKLLFKLSDNFLDILLGANIMSDVSQVLRERKGARVKVVAAVLQTGDDGVKSGGTERWISRHGREMRNLNLLVANFESHKLVMPDNTSRRALGRVVSCTQGLSSCLVAFQS